MKIPAYELMVMRDAFETSSDSWTQRIAFEFVNLQLAVQATTDHATNTVSLSIISEEIEASQVMMDLINKCIRLDVADLIGKSVNDVVNGTRFVELVKRGMSRLLEEGLVERGIDSVWRPSDLGMIAAHASRH